MLDFLTWCDLDKLRAYLTESFWFWVDKYFSYETTIAIKHGTMIIPFVIATFVLTCILCAWLSMRVRRQETLEKVSLLRVPSKNGTDEYYMAEPSSTMEILESACTFFFWKIIFKKKTIAFKDYKRARRTFRILLIIAIFTAVTGVISVFSVIWYPETGNPESHYHSHSH